MAPPCARCTGRNIGIVLPRVRCGKAAAEPGFRPTGGQQATQMSKGLKEKLGKNGNRASHDNRAQRPDQHREPVFDSENVVRAATWAKENNVQVIALTGFTGGRSATLADVNLHVTGDNYGIIEDVHQSLMHLLGQYLRQCRMSEDLIKQRKF